jgi:hypothetical protein
VSSSAGKHMAVNFWWLPSKWETAVETNKRMLEEVNEKLSVAN